MNTLVTALLIFHTHACPFVNADLWICWLWLMKNCHFVKLDFLINKLIICMLIFITALVILFINTVINKMCFLKFTLGTTKYFCFETCFILVLNSIYCRGTRVKPMHHLKARRRACSWSQIMIPMVMRNLISVKFLCINSYIPLNLYLEQCLILLHTFVYGLLGMFL